MTRKKIREEIQDGVLYVKPRKAAAKKSRRKSENARSAKPALGGGVHIVPGKRRDRRGKKTEGLRDRTLCKARPQTLAELKDRIATDFENRKLAALAIGVGVSTLRDALKKNGRVRWGAREKVCRYYNIPLSVLEK